MQTIDKKRATDKLKIHTYYFISKVDNLLYAFLSLYPDVFTTHLLFNVHKRNQVTGFLQQLV